MPSKYRKKKKKKKVEEKPFWQFELTFDDVTMSETEGHFKDVKRLLEADYGEHEWNVKTSLVIISAFGRGDMLLDFKSDGSCWIVNYTPNSGDIYYNPDISCLTEWCQREGWKIPQPTEALARSNIRLWKKLWETLLIDSSYLDERFGERHSLRAQVRDPNELDPDDLDEVDDV
jgi:hypothetical protein